MSESNCRFELTVLPGFFAMVRLAADAPLPLWALRGDFFSITRTSEELSIVCGEDRVPSGLTAETGWRALKVQGSIALSEIGVLAGLAAPLADAKVRLFAISTFDTDYLLVRGKKLDAAIAALRSAGHGVVDSNALC
jgi:hypothetical protein